MPGQSEVLATMAPAGAVAVIATTWGKPGCSVRHNCDSSSCQQPTIRHNSSPHCANGQLGWSPVGPHSSFYDKGPASLRGGELYSATGLASAVSVVSVSECRLSIFGQNAVNWAHQTISRCSAL